MVEYLLQMVRLGTSCFRILIIRKHACIEYVCFLRQFFLFIYSRHHCFYLANKVIKLFATGLLLRTFIFKGRVLLSLWSLQYYLVWAKFLFLYTNSYNCQTYCSLLSEFEENMHLTCFPWVTSYKTQLSWMYKLHWLFFSSSRREQIRTKVIQTATPSTSPHEARLSSSCCLSINATQGNFRCWIYDSALVRSRDSVN